MATYSTNYHADMAAAWQQALAGKQDQLAAGIASNNGLLSQLGSALSTGTAQQALYSDNSSTHYIATTDTTITPTPYQWVQVGGSVRLQQAPTHRFHRVNDVVELYEGSEISELDQLRIEVADWLK